MSIKLIEIINYFNLNYCRYDTSIEFTYDFRDEKRIFFFKFCSVFFFEFCLFYEIPRFCCNACSYYFIYNTRTYTKVYFDGVYDINDDEEIVVILFVKHMFYYFSLL